MDAMHHRGGCWPTQQQGLLLRAALLRGKEAVDAWHEWESSIDIDHIDLGSQHLLPLLYRNLHTLGIEDPLLGRFKGVYRYAWYKNQLLLNTLATLLRSFRDADVETLILRGAALVLLYYKDHGLRPMNEIDLLVRTDQVLTAIDLLTKSGWTPEERSPEKFTETYLSISHAHGFSNAAGQGLALHWRVLSEYCCADADDDFWDVAVSTCVYDVSTYVLNPTDQLLLACIDGAAWDLLPSLRWVADAMMIMSTSQSEIDWDRLITQAQKHRLILPLRDTLSYLRDVLDAPVPLATLQSIQAMPVSEPEHREYEARTRPPGLTGNLPLYWFRYLRYSRQVSSAGLVNKLIGFPRFLQHLWGIEFLWQVPLHAALREMRWRQFALPD